MHSIRRRVGLRSDKIQTRQNRRRRADHFQSLDLAKMGNRGYVMRSRNQNLRKSNAVGNRLSGKKKRGNLKGVVSGSKVRDITNGNADNLRHEPDSIQINPGSLTISEDVNHIELRDDWKSSEASPNNQNNRRPTSAAAVSPTASIYDSDSETRALIFDDNKDKPISLDDINQSFDSHISRRISIDFMKELSLDSDSASKTVSIPTKDDTDEENDGDDVKEIVWTKKIATITSSSGNLIEDLDAECDESSTGSMTTIIGSEQSSSVGAGDDLEGIFRLEDETDRENNGDGDGCRSVDSIHSKCFVLFGDGDEDEDEDEDGNGNGEDSNRKRRHTIGPKTSRINPMTGKRSLTDDMREWRNTVLSSFTLLPPSPKKKKYNTRKAKRESVQEQHAYQLRNTTDSADLIVATDSTDSRELHNIAPYNRPGIRHLYGAKSIFNSAYKTATKQEEANLKQISIKVRIGDIIFVPDDEKNDGLKAAARIITANDSANKAPVTESGSEREKSDLPLPAATIDEPPVPERMGNCNKPDDPLPTNESKPGSIVTRTDIEKNGNVIESTQTVPIDVHSGTNDNKRRSSSLRERDISPQKKKKRRVPQRLNIAQASLRSTTNRNLEKNSVHNAKPVDEKLRSMNRKQKKTSCGQLKLEQTKLVQKDNETPLDRKRIINHRTRIAKKFASNPARRQGRDKMKLYFGTVVSKRIYEETADTFWHVVYDDGDEEDFDESELDKALQLYRHRGKRWDKNYSKYQQNLTGKVESSTDMQTADNVRESKFQTHNRMTISENTRQTALASSGRNERKVLKQGQKEINKGIQNCSLDMLSDDCDLSAETSDDDSVHVLDMVDLTNDAENIGSSVDIVDLTVNADK